MVSIATSFKSGQPIPEERLTFKLCPGTVIDLDDSSLPLGFLPIEVPRLTLQCGEHGKRSGGGSSPQTSCIIRGGGKRNPTSSNEWNTFPQRAYKNSAQGILGGGEESVAQVYVYGESAYEVTLKGLTFDNSVSEREVNLYNDYVNQFGKDSLKDEDNDESENGMLFGAENSQIEQEYDASVPSSRSSSSSSSSSGSGGGDGDSSWGGAEKLKENRENRGRNRKLQQEETSSSGGIQPAHRFASVAVRGKGYGDDAGPRLITIEDCRFEYHRGYAVLVSPGIQEPDMPMAPEFNFPTPPGGGGSNGGGGSDINSMPVNPQISGQLYNHNDGDESSDVYGDQLPIQDGNRKRRLNLLDNGEKYIPQDGLVSYYDNTAGKNYLDGRRVKIINTEFANNVISGDNVAGLITSAYSLTLRDCFFQKNNAKSMVFVYNNEALVDNTIFAENTVEVSTVIMASPKGSKPVMTSMKQNGEEAAGHTSMPTHIVERTCFLGSRVGMSNVLVTDVENTGFGQRDNHAVGTEFSWVSTCEGGAAEQLGNDCLETGSCDGTCVHFTAEKCMSDMMDRKDYDMLQWNGGVSSKKNGLVWGVMMGVAIIFGAGVLC